MGITLIILDGWGLRDEREGNAIALARTPVMDGLMKTSPWAPLVAHGEAVGLLPGQMGNSNVGHLNLGAGRVVYQDLSRISRAIADGSLDANEVLCRVADAARGGTLHLIGLVSDGGVHSHIDHIRPLLELARARGVGSVVVHAILDGRDVPPRSALGFIDRLEDDLSRSGTGRIGTVSGRYWGMDRDGRWDRVARAFAAFVHGQGPNVNTARDAVLQAYERGETDEFVIPTVIGDPRPMSERDAVLLFNFRADRMRQLARALSTPGFPEFSRGGYRPLPVAAMTLYDESLDIPVAFSRQYLDMTLGEVVARAGMRQARIAETEKFAHVTFFFSGGREEPFGGEERMLIPSPRVKTYDLQPEMSAAAVAERAAAAIRSREFGLVVINFANADMVGHTGVLPAAILAIEAVDRALGVVVQAVRDSGTEALIVGDHGNAEAMLDEAGEPQTAHTLSPVPCVGVLTRDSSLRPGILADVAPTCLDLLGLEQPPQMQGRSLLGPDMKGRQ